LKIVSLVSSRYERTSTITFLILSSRGIDQQQYQVLSGGLIGASNYFEVTMLFGLSSGAALATVVGVLIEVPVMLMLVRICLRTANGFRTVS